MAVNHNPIQLYRAQYLTLTIAQCLACQRWFLPVRQHCPVCQQATKILPLPFWGEVVSFTVIHKPAEGWHGRVPYVLAVIQLQDMPVRVLGQVVGSGDQQIKLGSRVRRVIRQLSQVDEKQIIPYGVKWQLV